jgi:hypothetical protein
MTWEIMTRVEGAISDLSNPAPLRYANRATGEIRECRSFSALVEDRDELANICRRVAEALGPAVLRCWEEGGPEAVDLAAAVRELRAQRDGHRQDVESPSIALIAAERRRQVEAEGWTFDHDDRHADEVLAAAAVCYAVPPDLRDPRPSAIPDLWPFEASSWKPSPDDRVRELVKAAALISAELDRLLREAGRP